MELIRSLLFHRLRPSPDYSWVGSCITCFEACSAFTRVTTCRLAESPYATLFTGGFSGFVASTAAPIATGWSDPVPGRVFSPAVVQCLFTAHCNRDVTTATRHGIGRTAGNGNSGPLPYLFQSTRDIQIREHLVIGINVSLAVGSKENWVYVSPQTRGIAWGQVVKELPEAGADFDLIN